MPNIRTYTNPIGGLTPDQRGTEALGRTAQALAETAGAQQREVAAQDTTAQGAIQAGQVKAQTMRSLGQDIGGAVENVGDMYVRYQTQQQVSRAGPVLAYMQNQWDQGWKDWLKTNDPSDPSTRQRFIDSVVQPALDKFQEGFSTKEGQAWAASQVKDNLEHQYAKTSADQATIAGAQTIQHVLDFSNLQNNNVTNDPTSYAVASKALDDYHDQMVAGASGRALSAPDQAALTAHLSEEHKKLAYSQVLGQIQANPVAGMAALEAGRYDHAWFDVSETPSLLRYGRTLQAAQESGQKAAEAAQRLQEKTDAEGFQKKLYEGVTYNPDGSANIPPDFLTTLTKGATQFPGMTPEMLKTTTDWAQSQIDRANRPDRTPSDLGTYAVALDQIANGASTPGEITAAIIKANTEGHLNNADAKELINKANSITPEQRVVLKDQTAYITSLTGYIDHTIFGKGDPVGQQQAYKFRKNAETLFQQQGDTPAVRAAIRNSVPAYSLTNKQAMSDMTANASVGAAPRVPVPDVGEVRNGYTFLGGDPASQSSWRKK